MDRISLTNRVGRKNYDQPLTEEEEDTGDKVNVQLGR